MRSTRSGQNCKLLAIQKNTSSKSILIYALGRRNRQGNMLILITAIVAVLVIALLFFMLGYLRFFFGQSEQVNALEAGSLAAARELSSIVVEDPYFGFMSLSDHPPIGEGTKAADGEPLPVLGINTILATTRLDLILAHEIGNTVMITLAERDAEKAGEAVARLNEALLAATNGATAQNIHGETVDVVTTARETYERNLQQNTSTGVAEIESFNLQLGWLQGGGSTVTEIPRPHNKSQVPPDKQINGRYRAFVNIPAHGNDFYFAGMGESASLVDVQTWREPDGLRPLSAVRAESVHVITVASAGAGASSSKVKSMACSIPPANRDVYPPGQLSVAFPHGRVEELLKIKDLIDNPQLKINPMPMFSPHGGDWPSTTGGVEGLLNGPISISGVGSGWEVKTADANAMGIFDWYRASKGKARIDSITTLIDQDLLETIPGANQIENEYQTYAFKGCPNDPNDPRMLAILGRTQDAREGYLTAAQLLDVWSLIPLSSTVLKGDGNGANHSATGESFADADLRAFWDGLVLSNQKGWEALEAIENFPASTVSQALRKHIVTERAKWVIFASYHISQQIRDLSAHGIARVDQYTFRINRKFDFADPLNNDWTINFGSSGSTLVKMITTAPSIAEIASPTTALHNLKTNPGPSAHTWGAEGPDHASNWNKYKDCGAGGHANHFYFAVSSAQTGSGHNRPWIITKDPDYQGKAVLPVPDDGMVVGSMPGGSGMDNPHPPNSALNTLHLRMDNDGTIRMSYGNSPFGGEGISEKQVYGVALGAITVGEGNPVTWTALLRDQVRNWGRSEGGRHAGQAVAGNPPDFINNPAFGGVPGTSALQFSSNLFRHGNKVLSPQPRMNYMSGGLAVEIQIRNPLVLKCNTGEDKKVKGKNQSPASILPTVPPNLL